jgi:hypothetical protein
VKEGKAVRFRVLLATQAVGPFTMTFEALKGTAKRGKDFKPAAGTLDFLKGETVHVVKVRTKNDRRDERKEKFTLQVTVAGVTATGKAAIRDDD